MSPHIYISNISIHLIVAPYCDVVREVEPAWVLAQVVPLQVELEHCIANIGAVSHVPAASTS